MSTYLIHAANVLILVSFLVRDILALRALSIGAGLCFIPFFYFAQADGPMWAPIAWNLLFMAVNLVQIWRLCLERRPVHLSPDESEVHQLALRCLTPREAIKLLEQGAWHDVGLDTAVCTRGKPLDELLVLVSGRVRVERGGEELAQLDAGRLIGEMSYLTGEPPAVDVRPLEPCRFFAWDATALKAFLKDRAELRGAFQRILGADLSRKLKASQRLTSAE